jgi:hypothetical protein
MYYIHVKHLLDLYNNLFSIKEIGAIKTLYYREDSLSFTLLKKCSSG